MKTLLMITLLLLGANLMSADTIVAKVPIEGGFKIKLGEVMTPERLVELEAIKSTTKTGEYKVFPFGKKNLRNSYFVATNTKGEVYEILATTIHDPKAFGDQHFKGFCLKYGDVPDDRTVSWSDPGDAKRTLLLTRDFTRTFIWYYDKGLSNRVKTK